EDPPIRKHTTPGLLLCETVHAAGPRPRPSPSQRPSAPTPLTPGPIQNISGVAQGPAVRSVIPWVSGEPTVQPWPWHKAGGARPDVRHETTRVHRSFRRRGGGVAARGARADVEGRIPHETRP